MPRKARFSLILDPQADDAELRVECGRCSMVTTMPLDAAWRSGFVTCRECGVQGALTAEVLRELRDQANLARSDLDRLLNGGRRRRERMLCPRSATFRPYRDPIWPRHGRGVGDVYS